MKRTMTHLREHMEHEILAIRRRIEPARNTVQQGEQQIRRIERALKELRGDSEPQPDIIAENLDVTTGEVIRYLSQQDRPVAIGDIRDALKVPKPQYTTFGKFVHALVERGTISQIGKGRSSRYRSI